MPRTKYIYISGRVASEAIKSKDTLDALALAVSCKLLFVNSTIKDAKISRVMALFGVGHSRAKRAIEAGIKAGYFKRSENGGDLIATQLKEYGAFNVRIRRPGYTASRLTRRGNPIKAQFSLTQICNFIREAKFINHISIQQDLFDTLSKTERPQHPDEFRRATKKLSKHDMQAKNVDWNGRTLSYKRMAEHLSCSPSKAKHLVKKLAASGVIAIQHTFEETGMHINEFSMEIRKQYSKFINRGFLVLKNGFVVTQIANTYSLLQNYVRYLPKRKFA